MAAVCACGCGQTVSAGRKWRRGHNTSPLGVGHEYVVDEGSGCWTWQKSTNGRGYPRARFEGQVGIVYAHRVYFERANGPIPAGMTVHHRCHNRRCVNPAHMLLLSRSEHSSMHSSEAAAKRPPARVWHCEQCGTTTSRGSSVCRSCSTDRRRAYKAVH